MQSSSISAHVPQSDWQPTSGRVRSRTGTFVLLLLIVGLVAGSLYWLRWAAQRGIVLGYPPPQVYITSSTGRLLLNRANSFATSATGRDLSYSWYFSDRTQDYGSSVQHTFHDNGSFTVTVIVRDDVGQAATDTLNVQVFPPPPVAYFSYYVNYYYYSGAYVSFDASNSSVDPSTSLVSYFWDFGDGNTDTTGYYQEGHNYYYAGTYTITLIVTDGTGQRSDPYATTIVIS